MERRALEEEDLMTAGGTKPVKELKAPRIRPKPPKSGRGFGGASANASPDADSIGARLATERAKIVARDGVLRVPNALSGPLADAFRAHVLEQQQLAATLVEQSGNDLAVSKSFYGVENSRQSRCDLQLSLLRGGYARDNEHGGSGSNSNSNDDDDPNVVLMHLRALKRDGSILLDTRQEGRPVLFRLGSIAAEELYYINEGKALSKGRIPLGVQDAILAQGTASWEGGYGKADAMRYGGLRMVVVPPELAYGTNGVSRYEAYKLGLKAPVARNELLRYEIELFRCNDDRVTYGADANANDANTDTNAAAAAAAPKARACCLDEFYPCQKMP
mmetsp:Transcript_24503/g.53662  ORF Transcript_24503/g.53662 Transcript_24503/m.53662 type:complete len:332 (-) Transcript_24503:988-1983(-)